ncbi:MAG: long-chain fatty acid--CoA ligase [Hyphomicrobiales bacterium]|nr:MAG: long-chain fatty acid--CoA ligase [Hyphomicrobiales bacterium]
MNAPIKSGTIIDYTSKDGCDTMATLFRHRCKKYGKRTAHREKDLGVWNAFSWEDYFNHAKWIGLGLRSLGLKRGDVISILSEDNKEWLYFDLGAVCIGAIPSGVYTTDSASQLAYLVNDSGTSFLIVENDEQLDKFLEVRDEMPTLKKVIVIDRDGLRDFHDDMVMFADELYELGKAEDKKYPKLFDAEIDMAKPEDIRMLIYTSGTTGRPKGAMITHSNMIFQIKSVFQLLHGSESDEQLCFLPLCHVLERLFSVDSQIAVGSTVNFSESPETVFENLQEVSPHVFVAVPRLWEKIYSRLQILRKEATPIGRWAFDWAVAAGMKRAEYQMDGEAVPSGVSLNYKFWDFFVLGNLRRMIGMDRIVRGGTGAAPISPELLKWYWSIGIPVLEGFGMTESAGVATINTVEHNKVSTIGITLPGAETRISKEGEIQLKGPHVFKGYWNNPEKTAETMTEDGWLKTGDMGRVDNQGYFTITGRIKDIIITAGGKNITPAEIESALKFSPYISDAVVIGDKRKYLSCLIMIDQENVENFAQEKQIPFSDFTSLCAAPEVVELIGKDVAAVNKQFARVEQIKDYRLIDILLTAEDEELTPTMKLKRGFVESRHKGLIDSMYK